MLLVDAAQAESSFISTETLEKFGLPLVILVVLAWAIWRVAVWLRPWFERVLNAHLAFVDSVRESQVGLTKEVERAQIKMAQQSVRTEEQVARLATATHEGMRQLAQTVEGLAKSLADHRAKTERQNGHANGGGDRVGEPG
jgi:hypothetical protein